MIYFLREGLDGPVKIGYSREATSRMVALQSAHAKPLRVLRVLSGGKEVERWFHTRFINYRIRGEWFNFAREMLTDEPAGRGILTLFVVDRRYCLTSTASPLAVRVIRENIKDLDIVIGNGGLRERWAGRGGDENIMIDPPTVDEYVRKGKPDARTSTQALLDAALDGASEADRLDVLLKELLGALPYDPPMYEPWQPSPFKHGDLPEPKKRSASR